MVATHYINFAASASSADLHRPSVVRSTGMVLPTTLSIRTYEQIRTFLKKEKLRNVKMRTFFSMVDRRKKMHRDILDDFAASEKQHLSSFIPYSSVVEKMGVERRPVVDFAPRSLPAAHFQMLWNQVAAALFSATSSE